MDETAAAAYSSKPKAAGYRQLRQALYTPNQHLQQSAGPVFSQPVLCASLAQCNIILECGQPSELDSRAHSSSTTTTMNGANTGSLIAARRDYVYRSDSSECPADTAQGLLPAQEGTATDPASVGRHAHAWTVVPALASYSPARQAGDTNSALHTQTQLLSQPRTAHNRLLFLLLLVRLQPLKQLCALALSPVFRRAPSQHAAAPAPACPWPCLCAAAA